MENVNWKIAVISVALVALLVPIGLTATSASNEGSSENFLLAKLTTGDNGEYYASAGVSNLPSRHNVPVTPGGPDLTMTFDAILVLMNVVCPQGAVLTASIQTSETAPMTGFSGSVSPTKIVVSFTQGGTVTSTSTSVAGRLIINISKGPAQYDHEHTIIVKVVPPAAPPPAPACVASGASKTDGQAPHTFRTIPEPTSTSGSPSKTGNKTGGDGGGSPSITLPAVLATTAVIALIVRARRRGEE